MKILRDLKLEDLIIFDIETVRVVRDLELNTPLFDSWEYKKRRDNQTDLDLVKSYEDESALYAEFAKIVCISVGVIKQNKLYIKSYNDDNEKDLLQKFSDMLYKITNQNGNARFLGFANKQFDEPFVTKRSIINGVELHHLCDTNHLKPWEKSSVDIKELWSGGSWSSASLINITTALGLPSPKDDISGKDVGRVYYEEGKKGLERITKYCEKDVISLCNVLMKMRYEDLLEVVYYDDSKTQIEDQQETPSLIVSLKNGGKYQKKEKEALIGLLSTLSDSERKLAFDILKTIPSRAKGSVTKFTSAHYKELVSYKF